MVHHFLPFVDINDFTVHPPAASPKGQVMVQVAVQAAALTAPAPNQKMRGRNLHQ